MTLASSAGKHERFEACGRRGKEKGNTESNVTMITSLLPRIVHASVSMQSHK
jgi:hypothetical protein